MTEQSEAARIASIHQRLLNISKANDEDFQFVLIRYGLERFLYRLSVSEYRKQFILKGAMLSLVWGVGRYRPTRDLDFEGTGDPSPEALGRIVREICALQGLDDGLSFDMDSIVVRAITAQDEYPGNRVALRARLGNARIPIQVDVAYGDAVTPGPIESDFPSVLDLPTPKILMYPRETVVAEKLEAMVDLGMANSRMKDFFDMAFMLREFAFDGEILARAIRATFEARGTAIPTAPPIALTADFAAEKEAQWQALLRKSGIEGSGSLEGAIGKIAAFVMPPLLAASVGEGLAKQWEPGGPWT